MRTCVGICLLLLLAMPAVGAAQGGLGDLFDVPCARYGVPKALALAIARHESGLRPWVMNIAGKPVLTTRQDEALAIARQALRLGLSFDIGVMQVNSQWLRRYHLPLEVVFDPRGNVQVGVWILAQAIKRYGLTWQAIATYHTSVERNPTRAWAYASAILARLRNGTPATRITPQDSPETAKQAPILVKRFRELASNEEKTRRNHE